MLTKADLTAETLASVLEQSMDCIKLIGLDFEVLWMNANGVCLMEIDDFVDIENRLWEELWPEESRSTVRTALIGAALGQPSRFDAYSPTAKGTMKRWSVTVSQLHNAKHSHVGYLAVSRDISNIGLCPSCGG